MADQKQNAPLETMKDGALKATLWKNQGSKGPYVSITLVKVFKDDAGYHETNSYMGGELLRLSELARAAYAKEKQYRAEFANEASRGGPSAE